MSFPDRTVRTSTARGGGTGDVDSWEGEERPARDWKKITLMAGLGLLSWVATYVGMLELIEANMGELPLVHKLIIGFSVGMLMLMVVWLLDEMFKPNPFSLKVIYAAGYTFLTIISVGFGFGFYWKVLESRGESTRSAESAVTQVQGSLTAASARLDQLQQTLDQLTGVSLAKAQSERASGTSCPASKPGDGPRRRLREEDASKFQFASEFVKGRATSVKAEMSALDGDLAKIASADKSTIDATGTRNAFMQGVGRKLDQTVTGFNAFRTDPQLKQIRADLAERSEKTTFPDGAGKTFSCPDAQLQTALRGVVRAIDGLPELEKPKIAAVEGSEATIEAFRRLVATFSGALALKLPPSADELRELQKKAIQSVENPTAAAAARANEQPGLSKRDYIPLAIAIFVDLCLLLVAMGRNHNRLAGLVPKMRAAERGPVIQILSRFNDIHRDRQIRENFDLFRHVVFDFHGDYYVAVPLDAPKRLNPHEREELRLEAQLLSNLFASFEKERIFSRVYSPLLTTGAIRKRLGRQGSKFAASDAFRIYRFKDGAWSDIILGAVMGAARRVEAEKRTLALRADELAANAPLPDPAHELPYVASAAAATNGTRYGQPHDERSVRPMPPSFSYSFAGPRGAASDGSGAAAAAEEAAEWARRFGSYAAYAARPQSVARYADAEPSVQNPMGPRENRYATQGYAENVHPLYPANDPPTGEDIDRDLRPANSNTASTYPGAGPASRSREPGRASSEVMNSGRSSDARGDTGGLAGVVPFSPARTVPQGVPQSEPSLGAVSNSAPPALGGQSADHPAARAESPVLEAVMKPAANAVEPTFATLQSAGDWQRQLGIIMTRVTESVAVPVSTRAELPLTLMSDIERQKNSRMNEMIAVEAAPQLEAGYVVRPTTVAEPGTPQRGTELPVAIGSTAVSGDWSETDTALARRYVRAPAE